MKLYVYVVNPNLYCKCDVEHYESLGFVTEFDREICLEEDVYPIEKEFFTLESLMQYLDKCGETIINGNTITVYNDYVEK